MATKEHVKKFGATCATTLRLTKPLHGSGRVIIADSWFGSVKTVSQLRKAGLHAAMVVKTAHKMYPVDLLSTNKLKRGEWGSYTSEIDGVKLMATSFMDLKLKQFISTCSTSLEGQPRVTKHGVVPRPQVAEMYLRNAASIDIHNHVRIGGLGCEDVLVTVSYHMRQFAGILGFLFTNSYLAFKKFKHREEKTNHVNFKVKLATTLCKFQPHVPLQLRSSFLGDNTEDLTVASHKLVKLDHPLRCHYCTHGYEEKRTNSTTFKCSYSKCNKPICKPTSKRNCWKLHLELGQMPTKVYRMTK